MPPSARARTVAARVALTPTSQSASARERAASSSGRSSVPGRRCANAPRMAARVIDENQARSTGSSPAFASSRMYAKISSPSRPASHAFTRRSMSRRATSLRIVCSCSLADSLSARATI